MAASFNPKAALRVRANYEKMELNSVQVKQNWFKTNYERVYMNPSIPEDKKPKKAAVLFNELKRLEKEAAERKLEAQRKKAERQPVEEEEEVELTPAELLARGPMYPVPVEVKEVLYHGISHNDEGRKLYLKLRNKQDVRLEAKFYDPMTITQGVGWNVQERFIPTKRYGKRAIIQQSFYRKSGVLKSGSPYWRPPNTESVAGFKLD